MGPVSATPIPVAASSLLSQRLSEPKITSLRGRPRNWCSNNKRSLPKKKKKKKMRWPLKCGTFSATKDNSSRFDNNTGSSVGQVITIISSDQRMFCLPTRRYEQSENANQTALRKRIISHEVSRISITSAVIIRPIVVIGRDLTLLLLPRCSV